MDEPNSNQFSNKVIRNAVAQIIQRLLRNLGGRGCRTDRKAGAGPGAQSGVNACGL